LTYEVPDPLSLATFVVSHVASHSSLSALKFLTIHQNPGPSRAPSPEPDFRATDHFEQPPTPGARSFTSVNESRTASTPSSMAPTMPVLHENATAVEQASVAEVNPDFSESMTSVGNRISERGDEKVQTEADEQKIREQTRRLEQKRTAHEKASLDAAKLHKHHMAKAAEEKAKIEREDENVKKTTAQILKAHEEEKDDKSDTVRKLGSDIEVYRFMVSTLI